MNLYPWYKQLLVLVVPFVILSFLFPIPAWFAVVAWFGWIERITGYQAALVGNGQQLEPGAVLVALIYGLLSTLYVILLVRKKHRLATWCAGVLSPVMLVYVVVVVSSVVWF